MKNPVYFDTQNFPVAQMYFVDSLELTMDFPLHRHSFVELEYICGGKGSNVINGVEYPLGPGKASLLMPWHVHELKSDKDDPLQIYKCSFRTDFLASGDDPLGKLSRVLLDMKDYRIVTELDEDSRDRFERVFRLALEESGKNVKYKDASMAALISEMVVLFLRCSDTVEREAFTVWDVVRHVQMVYRDPALMVEDVAYFFSENKITYAQTFKQGSMVVDYSLDRLGEELDPALFFRATRQILLCSRAVSKIENYFQGKVSVTLSPAFKDQVLVSKEKADSFKRWLNY